MAAQQEEPVEAVEGPARLALPGQGPPPPPAATLPVVRETQRVVVAEGAELEPSSAIMGNTGAAVEAAAGLVRLPDSTVDHLYMAAGPERVVVGLPGPEESAGSGVLILRAVAGLLGPRTGTPAGLALVMPSAAATAEAAEAVGPRIRTAGPAGPAVYRAEREAEELRVGLVPGREV